MGLGKSKEKVAKELFEEEITTAPSGRRTSRAAPVYDADHGTVEKANQKNPPNKTAPKVPPTE